jgi:capsular polysaccharide export protein
MLISYSSTLTNIARPFKRRIENQYGNLIFIGWGRRKYGEWSRKTATFLKMPFLCLEDGFIRSINIGKDPNIFSILVDDIGIYYDATRPSKLENLLNDYDFKSDQKLLKRAKVGIENIIFHNITKYNHVSKELALNVNDNGSKKILIIAQTLGDLSLQYGYGNQFTTQDLIDAARKENPNSELYLKVHPDVLHGIKKSDIDLELCKEFCTIISEDVNPISLLKYFDAIYTKTSQMGFEALLLGKKTVCFGAPFYSGWGLTDDRVKIPRRKRILSLEEIFAAAYILYPLYHNPYTNESCEFEDIVQLIADRS